ncbi:hypothetical protein KIPB_013650, partial [Kipferlia bialata]
VTDALTVAAKPVVKDDGSKYISSMRRVAELRKLEGDAAYADRLRRDLSIDLGGDAEVEVFETAGWRDRKKEIEAMADQRQVLADKAKMSGPVDPYVAALKHVAVFRTGVTDVEVQQDM